MFCARKNHLYNNVAESANKYSNRLKTLKASEKPKSRETFSTSLLQKCICHLRPCNLSSPPTKKDLSVSTLLDRSRRRILFKRSGWTSRETNYFPLYFSQSMSPLPQSRTLEDHLEAWNIPEWLPSGECRHAFQSEGGSRAGWGPRGVGCGLGQARRGTPQRSEHRDVFVHLSVESWLCLSVCVCAHFWKLITCSATRKK